MYNYVNGYLFPRPTAFIHHQALHFNLHSTKQGSRVNTAAQPKKVGIKLTDSLGDKTKVLSKCLAFWPEPWPEPWHMSRGCKGQRYSLCLSSPFKKPLLGN